MITGRKKDSLWRNFIEIPASSSSTTGVGGKTARAQCKHCRTNIVGLIARMRTHLEKCSDYASKNSSASTSSRIQICENDSSDDAHFAAYILGPNYNGDGLSEEEDTIGMEFLDSSCPNAMKDVLAYRARSYPFLEYMFKKIPFNKNACVCVVEIRIERLFSSFGLVHSKLRNKLGTEKAAKLVAIMRALNQYGSLEKLQIMEVEG
ncbi:unnamed protein product [Diatraea saccharalis]|uniref:BED-type domain-containing protein n=1 Tax=Diatraea saccharalis TaxID=40085 RepID=A0A9N9WFM6_9NEOP|nr:unnamed protein product [Diatraea saccharalis]